MGKKYSYVLLGDPAAVKGTKTKKEPLLSGLWQVSLAFDKYGKKGDVRLIRRKEDFEEYDCVHVNMTGGNFALLHHIRDELGNSSSTKLITNIDFDVSVWGVNWPYPTLLEKALNCADLVFHVESRGAAVLEHVLKRHVPVLPHPVDVKGLDSYKKIDREPYIVNIHHRYEQDITTPYWAMQDLPLYRVLIGYSKGTVSPLAMYDQTFKYSPFLEAIDIMSRATFGLDLFHRYNYGRAVVEFAALAVPCVCSETIDACHRCFPDLCVNPLDIKRVNELFWKLIKDEEFREETYKKAFFAADYYSQEACYNRMATALEEIEDKGSNSVAPKISVGDGLAEEALGEFWQKGTTVNEHKQFWTGSDYKKAQEIQVRHILHQYCPNINSILDAGAGTCRVGKALKDIGYKYVAVDFSDTMLAECDPEFETKVAKLTDLPFNDNTFDVVMCLHVIRHNNPEDYGTIINELCRVSSKYVLVLNPFASRKEDVKQIFKREIWDMPIMGSDLDDMMSNAGFHKSIAIPATGDYKELDRFVLYALTTEEPDKDDDRKDKDAYRGWNDVRKDKKSDMWQQIQDRYVKRSYMTRRADYLQYIRYIANSFKDFIGIRDGLILDIGCGNGMFCAESYETRGQVYIDKKNTIIGLDPLESTENRFPVVRGFGEKIPFQDASFDTVVIASTLDHVIDPIVVVKEAKRVLKNGGKLFTWDSIHPEGKVNHWHLHTWTKESLLEMIGEVFTVTRHKTVGSESGGFNLLIEGGY